MGCAPSVGAGVLCAESNDPEGAPPFGMFAGREVERTAPLAIAMRTEVSVSAASAFHMRRRLRLGLAARCLPGRSVAAIRLSKHRSDQAPQCDRRYGADRTGGHPPITINDEGGRNRGGSQYASEREHRT